MKRLLVLCSMVVLSLFAVGCTKTIELTEEENHLIAEYAAELLLKYDRNIDLKYYYDEVTTEEPTTEAPVTEEPSTEEVTTEESTTEAATEEPTTEEVPTDSDATETITVEKIDEVVDSDFNIASMSSIENLAITYSYYMILDRYPSYDQEGMYIEIEAPAGYKLLVLKFNVENTTNQAQYVDLYSEDLNYNIIINNNRSAKQMLTILIDDLYTYQANMEGSMLEETVLLFQISDSIAESIEDLKLKVISGNEEKIIQLQ